MFPRNSRDYVVRGTLALGCHGPGSLTQVFEFVKLVVLNIQQVHTTFTFLVSQILGF